MSEKGGELHKTSEFKVKEIKNKAKWIAWFLMPRFLLLGFLDRVSQMYCITENENI